MSIYIKKLNATQSNSINVFSKLWNICLIKIVNSSKEQKYLSRFCSEDKESDFH